MNIKLRSIGNACRPWGLAAVLAMASPVFADRLTQNWKQTTQIFAEAKMTAAKAIEAAEAYSKGKAVSLHTVILQEKVSLWVHLLVNTNCVIVRVDPRTGQAGHMTIGVPADLSCSTAVEAAKLMEASKVDLVTAIAAAEAYGKGQVVASKTEVADGVLTLSFVTSAEGRAKVVTVDGKTGEAKSAEDVKETPRKGG